MPVHYYSPIPNTQTLPPTLWNAQSALVGLEFGQDEPRKLLHVFAARFKSEYEQFPMEKPPSAQRYYLDNTAFGSCDAEFLYCMVRHFRPKRVVEIGAGFTTLIIAQAIEQNRRENRSYRCDFATVEPNPSELVNPGMPGLSRLIKTPVQDVPLSEFTSLEQNDIVFIDSSHVLKVGSDVQYEYLEILPRLGKGVLVHIHDIFLPAEYPQEWICENRFFWNEQYLLQAFLAFNERFKVLWPGYYMHLTASGELRRAVPSYNPKRAKPSSFWMVRRD